MLSFILHIQSHICTQMQSIYAQKPTDELFYALFLGKPMQVFLIIQSKLQLPDTHTVQCHSVIRPLVSPRGWAVRSCQPHGTGRAWVGLGWRGLAWYMASPALASAAPWHCLLVPLDAHAVPPDVLGAPPAPGSATQRGGLSVGRAPPQRRGCVRRTVARLH